MDVRVQVTGLNRFLTEIYAADMRLSRLLMQLGFHQDEIDQLRHCHLGTVVTRYLLGLKERIVNGADGERRYQIIVRYHGLDGEVPETLEAIGKRLGISRERVRQLKKKVINKCRSKTNKAALECRLQEIGTELLRTSMTATIEQPHEQRADKASSEVKTQKSSTRSNAKMGRGKTYSVAEVRKLYPKAYERWTQEDDDLLVAWDDANVRTTDIATRFERTRGAIRSRMRKLGLRE